MPEFHHYRTVNRAAREEVVGPEWRGARIKSQPLTNHSQICPLVGQKAAFRVFNAGDFKTGEFSR